MKGKEGKKTLTVSAIENGTVIDHIPSEATFKVVEILDLSDVDKIISVATNLSSKLGKKGIIKIEGKNLTPRDAEKIALIAPDATMNIIENYGVIKKTKIKLPDEVINVIKCFNPNCITNNAETKTKFYVLNKTPLKLKCHYCERIMKQEDIELL